MFLLQSVAQSIRHRICGAVGSDLPDGRAVQADERVPLLLVRDGRLARRDGVLRRELLEAGDGSVVRLDGLGERDVALGVLVAVVADGLVGQGRQVFERGSHLGRGALEEAAAAGDEQRVAREDAAGMGGVVRRGVVADRVLRVARGVQTPGATWSTSSEMVRRMHKTRLMVMLPKEISSLSLTRLVNAGALLLPP